MPSRGITAAARTFPGRARLDLHVRIRERMGARAGLEPRAGACGVAPLGVAQRVEHERGAIIELQCKPVPACLVRAERAAPPFAIEPGRAMHIERVAIA